MNNKNILKDELDAIIASHILKGDNTTKIAVLVGKTERTIQLRWKSIIKRLHCKNSAHAAGKLAVECEKKHTRFPPNYSELVTLFAR